MLIVQRPQIEEERVSDDGRGSSLNRSNRDSATRWAIPCAVPAGPYPRCRHHLRADRGVQHEFSTMEGVVEDVVDFILNLKQVVIRVESEEPQTLYLSAKGKQDVTAGDLKVPPGSRSSTRICTSPASRRPAARGRDDRRARRRLPQRRPQQEERHHRGHSDRLDLLAGPQGLLQGGEHPGRSDDQLRQAHSRRRDQRRRHPGRGDVLGRQDAARTARLVRRPGRGRRASSLATW